jgi:hypothetical protein
VQIREAPPPWAGEQLEQQSGVLATASAVRWLGRAAVRWRLESGRWQRPCRGVVVTHAGPLTASQLRWAAVLGSGPGAVLAGLTAAHLSGLTGFEDRHIYLLVPASRRVHALLPGVVVHRSAILGPADIQPARQPPRTRAARSLLDAAAWAAADNRARAILAAGVQQRLVRADDLRDALARQPRIRRHALLSVTLADIAGGAEALSELDFCRLTRRYGLPEPERQVIRRDAAGRRRWLDCYWKSARLVVEVDGMWHMDAQAWWADMQRDNELTAGGYRVLRFPAFAVRDHPDVVARQLAVALGRAAA